MWQLKNKTKQCVSQLLRTDQGLEQGVWVQGCRVTSEMAQTKVAAGKRATGQLQTRERAFKEGRLIKKGAKASGRVYWGLAPGSELWVWEEWAQPCGQLAVCSGEKKACWWGAKDVPLWGCSEPGWVFPFLHRREAEYLALVPLWWSPGLGLAKGLFLTRTFSKLLRRPQCPAV